MGLILKVFQGMQKKNEIGVRQNYSVMLVSLFLYVVLFSQTLHVLFGEWATFSGLYSHGFLALGIVFYHIWLNRAYLVDGGQSLGYTLSFFAACLSMLWWVGVVTNTLLLQQLAVFVVFALLLLAFAGLRYSSRLVLPLSFLFLALPIWSFLQGPLRILSTNVTSMVLELIGMPFYLYGYTFSLPGGNFIVELSCSGLSFFLVSAVLALYFCHLHKISFFKSCMVIIFALALSVVANWIRIITIMVVGNATQMQHVVVQDHLTFGWIVYFVMLVPFLFLASKIDSTKEEDDKSSVEEVFLEKPQLSWKLAVIFVALSLGPVVNFASSFFYGAGLDSRVGHAESLFKEKLVGYDAEYENWTPKFIGADLEVNKVFVNDENYFQVYGAFYKVQEQGKELIYHANKAYDDKVWLIEKKQIAKIGEDQLILLYLSNTSRRRVLAYWYEVSGYRATSKYVAKMLEVVGAITGNTSASVSAVALDYSLAEEEKARKDIMSFLRDIEKL